MIKRKVIFVLLTFLLFVSPSSNIIRVLAENDQILTLNEVTKITIQNNGIIKAMDHSIHSKKIYLNEKVDAANRISSNRVNTLDLAKMKYFLPFDAQNQLQITQLDKEEQENNVLLIATKAYIDVTYLQQAIEVLQSGVKRAEEQVKIANLNYKLGVITKVDVLSAEVQLDKVKSELEQLKNNEKAKKMQLNQMMNRDLKADFNLENINVDEFVKQLPLGEDGINKGLEYSLNLKKQQLELESLKKLVEITKSFFPENTYVYQSAYSNKMTKEAMLDEAKSKLELGIRSQQIQLDSLKQKYNVMEKQTKKVEETYQIMFHQYKAGMISYQDLANEDQLLKQTNLEEIQAKLDYYKTYYEYLSMLGL